MILLIIKAYIILYYIILYYIILYYNIICYCFLHNSHRFFRKQIKKDNFKQIIDPLPIYTIT